MSAAGAVADTHAVLEKFVLGDLLDDDILGARPGDRSFALRVLLGELGARFGENESFTLLSGLNFFFRSELEEEDKMRLGLEVSRLYYAFTVSAALEVAAIRETSPLLAALMTSELTRLSFEAVDHAVTFDSRVHERAPSANPHAAQIQRPVTFLAKVAQNSMVRQKAKVMT